MISDKQRVGMEIIREKNVKVKLPEADCEQLAKLCGLYGLTVGELFEQFVSDLVNGTFSDGSDERNMARGWFERLFGKCSKETLLQHLLFQDYIIIDFLDIVDLLEDGKKTLDNAEKDKSNKYDKEEIDFLKDDIVMWERQYHEFIDGFVKLCPEADINEQINMVRKWYKEIYK